MRRNTKKSRNSGEKKIRILAVIIFAFVLILVSMTSIQGCSSATRAPSATIKALLIPSSEYTKALEEIEDILREHYFEIEIKDRIAGHIVTKPLISSQFFEFWRDDVLTYQDQLESSLHTIRRIAEVRLTPEGKHIKITITIYVQRKEEDIWVSLGNDPILASYLLDRIAKRLPAAEKITS